MKREASGYVAEVVVVVASSVVGNAWLGSASASMLGEAMFAMLGVEVCVLIWGTGDGADILNECDRASFVVNYGGYMSTVKVWEEVAQRNK